MHSFSSTSLIASSAAFVTEQATKKMPLAELEVKTSKTRTSSLADLRLAVKDLFHIQGIPTTAGNPTWLATHPLPAATNTSVDRLLDSGARYMGKTLTDELAYSLNGQNIHYQSLLNPLTPERLVGGSSSGSAVAVASNLADIGLGTDTGGSIRVPASYNGLFGLRTSHGAIPCDNMVPLAPSFDTIGWMCKNVEHLYRVALALLPEVQTKDFSAVQAIKIQNEANDPSNTFDINRVNDKSLNKPKIYVARNLIDKAEHIVEINAWLNTLIHSSITEGIFDLDSLNTSETFRILQGYEIWQQHGQWITEQQPVFADDVYKRFMWSKGLSIEQRKAALHQQQVFNQHVDTIFESNDLLIIPTTPGRSPLLGQAASTMARYREDLMSLTAVAGLSGRPQIHLPLFSIEGAPCGLSLIGEKNSDILLILLASELIKQSASFTLAKHTQ